MAISTSALAGPLRRREREKARIIVMMAVLVQVPCMVSYPECNIDLETEKGACCRVAHVLACSAIGVFEGSIRPIRKIGYWTYIAVQNSAIFHGRHVKCLWTEPAVAERNRRKKRRNNARCSSSICASWDKGEVKLVIIFRTFGGFWTSTSGTNATGCQILQPIIRVAINVASVFLSDSFVEKSDLIRAGTWWALLEAQSKLVSVGKRIHVFHASLWIHFPRMPTYRSMNKIWCRHQRGPWNNNHDINLEVLFVVYHIQS